MLKGMIFQSKEHAHRELKIPEEPVFSGPD